MRYIFLALLFFWIYLSIHLYFSFFHNLSFYFKLFSGAFCCLAIFIIISLHPIEFATGIKFSGKVMTIMDIMLATLATLFFIYLFTDILKIFSIYPSSWKKSEIIEGLTFVGIAALITILGMINDLTPTVIKYKIETDKNFIQEKVTVTAISDLHIGSASMSPEKLQKAVEKINATKPDLIFILGDIFDGKGSYNTFTDDNYSTILKDLKAKYGIFAITGNHEYYMPETASALQLLKNSGIKVLLDDSVYIKELNAFIIGRKDAASTLKDEQRMTLPQIMKRPQYRDADSLFIVLDHNPKYITESRTVHADLQLSGHTHNGQLFPLNIVEKFIYETSWGIKNKQDTTLFVSAGLGLWGPAVRTSSVSEIAEITISRKK